MRFHSRTSRRYAVHLVAGRERGGELFVGDDRIECLHQGSRPRAQLQPVLSLGHAEQVGDHREGERERDVGDHVDLAVAAGLGVGEEVVEEGLHTGSEVFDHSRGEDLGDEAAQAVMVGRIEVEHRAVALAAIAGERFALGIHHHGRHDGVALFDRERRIPQHPQDVVVTEQHPQPDGRLVHRIELPHLRVMRVRVCREVGVEGIEDRFLYDHAQTVITGRRPVDVTSVTQAELGCREK